MAAGLAEASGAGAGIILAARQAQVCTAPIVGPTAVSPCCWLTLRMQCVDVHGEVEFVSDDLLVLALANNSFPIPSIKVSPLDYMVFGIHPVHPMPCIVNGQPIGPE